MFESLERAKSFIGIIFETGSNKLLGLRTDSIFFWRINGKLNFKRTQNNPLSQDLGLREPIPKRLLSIQHLEKDDPDRPNINLRWHMCLLLIKNLRRQVPISPYSRRCQLYLGLLALNQLADAKIDDFDHPIVKEHVCRFEVEVHYLHFLLVQIFDRIDELPDYVPSLPLIKAALFLDVTLKLRARTILHDKAETTIVDLELIDNSDYVRMLELLVRGHFTLEVFDQILLGWVG